MPNRISRFRRVEALIDWNDLDGSIQRLEEHITYRPEDAARAHERIACCYCNLNRYESRSRAIEHYRRAHQLDPDDSDALRAWATCYASDHPTYNSLMMQADAVDQRSGQSPPNDPRDVPGWDRFWRFQLKDEANADEGLPFALAPSIVPALARAGLRSVLEVGAGIGREPAAFAWAGFAATALDISPVAIQHARSEVFTAEDARRFYGDDADDVHRGDGRLTHVVGDFLDRSVCPGPFDVVVSRRTIQYYRGDMLPIAIGALMCRVADPGLVVIHSHNSYDSDREIARWLRELAIPFAHLPLDRAVQVTSFSPPVVALLATSG